MASSIACPDCGHTMQSKKDLAGKKVRCKGCSTVFVVADAPAGGTAPNGLSGAVPPLRAAQDPTPDNTATPPDPEAEFDSEAATMPDVGATAQSVAAPTGMDQDAIRTLWGNTVESDADPAMSIQSVVGGSDATSGTSTRSSSKPERLAYTGGLTVSDRIGKGGMGAIHRAEQESLHRSLAVKTILPGKAADGAMREKFIAEALVTGELDHPNIVPVHELGRAADGTLFYAMKEVTGTSWQDALPEKSETDNLRILLDVCDAMAFAHDKGYVHRDLKPENVMLGEYGEVYVMDWGLAVTTREDGHGEKVSAKLPPAGTPAYMAPEMAACEGVRVGPWSDIYLLGGILYEIATGLRPHTGETVYMCLVNAAENVIQEIPEGKESELTDIALIAMAADPEERYESVPAFQAAIRAYLAHQESIALTVRAEEDLAEARSATDYTLYAKAVFGFEQAVELWDGNRKAKRLLASARLAYAKAAHKGGDYDLALSQLDGKVRRHRKLIKQVNAAKTERDRRRKRLRVMTGAAAIAGLLVVLLSVGAALWIGAEKQAAIEAKHKAELALAQAEEQKAKAERTLKWLGESQQETIIATLQQELSMANPEYEGDGVFKVEYGKVVEADLSGCHVADLYPLKDLPLRVLDLSGSQVTDIEPLYGMPLNTLNLLNTWVSGLGPIHQTRTLKELAFSPWTVGAGVEDIRGMKWLDSFRIAEDREPLTNKAFWSLVDQGEFRDKGQQDYADSSGKSLYRTIQLPAGVEMKFVLIPPGTFTMGDGGGAHQVRITKGFYLGVYEVTREQWHAVTKGKALPEEDEKKTHAQAGISWTDIAESFLPELNKHAPEGMRFKLPTEAEWEYACRAGTTTAYAFGDKLTPQMANFNESGIKTTCKVGSYAPNNWGLYDMHGNVAEWCEDWYDEDYYKRSPAEDPANRQEPKTAGARVLRGGDWGRNADYCRSANRNRDSPAGRGSQPGSARLPGLLTLFSFAFLPFSGFSLPRSGSRFSERAGAEMVPGCCAAATGTTTRTTAARPTATAIRRRTGTTTWVCAFACTSRRPAGRHLQNRVVHGRPGREFEVLALVLRRPQAGRPNSGDPGGAGRLWAERPAGVVFAAPPVRSLRDALFPTSSRTWLQPVAPPVKAGGMRCSPRPYGRGYSP